ncbi:hypothetical protein MMPV_005238 [Pyropia vietnamensis]
MADGPSTTTTSGVAAAAVTAAAVPPPAVSQPRPNDAGASGIAMPSASPAGNGGSAGGGGCTSNGTAGSGRSPQRDGKRRGRAVASVAVDLPFDPARFTRSLSLYGVRVMAARCHDTRAALGAHVLRLPRVANVVRHPETGEVTLLTRYRATDEGGEQQQEGGGGAPTAAPASDLAVDGTVAAGTSGEGHPDGDAAVAAGHVEDGGTRSVPPHPIGNVSNDFVGVPTALLDALNAPRSAAAPSPPTLPASSLVVEAVTLTYAHLPADAVLRALLPPGVIPPSAFETIGHVVHLNLRAPQLPHRHLIGAVLLDKLRPRIRTVVNKTAATGGPFRTFAHEVLAGDDDMAATVVENGCKYAVAVGAVYWNSRLEGEHRRLVAAVPRGGVLVDACAGVGPFVVPFGKTPGGGVALACDLNGESVRLCRANVQRNGVGGRVAVDGPRDGAAWLAELGARGVFFDALVLNMPSGAPELLSVLRGLYARHVDAKGGDGGGAAAAAAAATAAAADGPDAKRRKRVIDPSACVNATAAATTVAAVALDRAWLHGRGYPPAVVAALERTAAAQPMPTVHCSAFAAMDRDWAGECIRRVSAVVYGYPPAAEASGTRDADGGDDRRPLLPGAIARIVRQVAPNKVHVCTTFTLPRAVAFDAS